jgi:hypothetical protein
MRTTPAPRILSRGTVVPAAGGRRVPCRAAPCPSGRIGDPRVADRKDPSRSVAHGSRSASGPWSRDRLPVVG